MNEVVIAGAARTPMGGFREFDGVDARSLKVALKAPLTCADCPGMSCILGMYYPQVGTGTRTTDRFRRRSG